MILRAKEKLFASTSCSQAQMLRGQFSWLPWIDKVKPDNRVPEKLQGHKKKDRKGKKLETVTPGV